MAITQENISELLPKTKTPEIFGRLFYNEGAGAWHIIRLRKEILQKFPQLKEKSGSFCYKMLMPQDYKEMKQIVSEMQKGEVVVPIILSLCRVKG
jgi:hypothetical protein